MQWSGKLYNDHTRALTEKKDSEKVGLNESKDDEGHTRGVDQPYLTDDDEEDIKHYAPAETPIQDTSLNEDEDFFECQGGVFRSPSSGFTILGLSPNTNPSLPKKSRYRHALEAQDAIQVVVPPIAQPNKGPQLLTQFRPFQLIHVPEATNVASSNPQLSNLAATLLKQEQSVVIRTYVDNIVQTMLHSFMVPSATVNARLGAPPIVAAPGELEQPWDVNRHGYKNADTYLNTVQRILEQDDFSHKTNPFLNNTFGIQRKPIVQKFQYSRDQQLGYHLVVMDVDENKRKKAVTPSVLLPKYENENDTVVRYYEMIKREKAAQLAAQQAQMRATTAQSQVIKPKQSVAMMKLEKVLRMKEQWVRGSSKNESTENLKKAQAAPALRPKGFNFPVLQKMSAPLYTSDNLLSTASWQTLTRVALKDPQESTREQCESTQALHSEMTSQRVFAMTPDNNAFQVFDNYQDSHQFQAVLTKCGTRVKALSFSRNLALFGKIQSSNTNERQEVQSQQQRRNIIPLLINKTQQNHDRIVQNVIVLEGSMETSGHQSLREEPIISPRVEEQRDSTQFSEQPIPTNKESSSKRGDTDDCKTAASSDNIQKPQATPMQNKGKIRFMKQKGMVKSTAGLKINVADSHHLQPPLPNLHKNILRNLSLSPSKMIVESKEGQTNKNFSPAYGLKQGKVAFQRTQDQYVIKHKRYTNELMATSDIPLMPKVVPSPTFQHSHSYAQTFDDKRTLLQSNGAQFNPVSKSSTDQYSIFNKDYYKSVFAKDGLQKTLVGGNYIRNIIRYLETKNSHNNSRITDHAAAAVSEYHQTATSGFGHKLAQTTKMGSSPGMQLQVKMPQVTSSPGLRESNQKLKDYINSKKSQKIILDTKK
ncbi:hypothetical protein FGO68_gene13428 [Halteria grandinella]|uniref:Uncharacterized protein n=1 Tax=Halteria grandinella TaxID=5974 RepID=A0A8J8P0Z1_HALGN|nr:hypothetical protein FGO68_gene13428 [Halteria grandinella]